MGSQDRDLSAQSGVNKAPTKWEQDYQQERARRAPAHLVGDYLRDALFPRDNFFKSGRMVETSARPGFPEDLQELWIGPNRVEGADGNVHKALQMAYKANAKRFEGKPVNERVDGEMAGYYVVTPNGEIDFTSEDKLMISDNHQVFLDEAKQQDLLRSINLSDYKDKRAVVFGTFHAHPPSHRVTAMSVDDVALLLIRPSEDAPNPYMMHTMTDGKGVEAVVRLGGAPILTRAEYEQVRAEWNARSDVLGKRYNSELEQAKPAVQEAMADKVLTPDNAISYAAEYIHTAIQTVYQRASEQLANDPTAQDVISVAALTLEAIPMTITRHINAAKRDNGGKLTLGLLQQAVNEAHVEAASYATAKLMIYGMCQAFDLLYLTNAKSKNEMKLVVDENSRRPKAA